MKNLFLLVCLVGTALSQRPAPQWELYGTVSAWNGARGAFGIAFDSHNMYVLPNGHSFYPAKTSNGKAWTTISKGLDPNCMTFTSVSYTPNGSIFGWVSCPGGGNKAYVLNNVTGAGDAWTEARLPNRGSGTGFVANGCDLAGDGKTMLCGTTGSKTIYGSTDGGFTWSAFFVLGKVQSTIGEILRVHTFTDVAGAKYTCAGVANSSRADAGPYCSNDNGHTWYQLGPIPGYTFGARGDSNPWLDEISTSPYRHHMIYVQGGGYNDVAHGSGWWAYGPYAPRPGGQPASSWHWIGSGANAPLGYFVNGPKPAANRTNTRLIAIRGMGLAPIYSDDGVTWALADTGLTCSGFVCGTLPSPGLTTNPKITALATNPNDGHVYISDSGGNIWRTTTSQDFDAERSSPSDR